MKHLKEYDDEAIKGMIDDLESIGLGGLIGFMWIGYFIPTQEHVGFLVIGKDEQDCIDLIIESKILEHQRTQKLGFKGKFVEFLEDLQWKSIIKDAGHYPDLKARGNKRMVKCWYDSYTMNPKYCYDQAEEYFKNAKEIFSKEEPEWEIWEPQE